MNYYKARQRQTDGRWDYTVGNDGHVRPVGYCGKFSDKYPFHVSEEYLNEIRATAHKHHTDGHATAEEACECYRQYLLDHHLRLKGDWKDTQHQCEACGAWTSLYAEIDMRYYNLCEQHNNLEEVEKRFEAPGEIWSS